MSADANDAYARAIAASGKSFGATAAARPAMPIGKKFEALKPAVRQAAEEARPRLVRALPEGLIELGIDERGDAVGVDLNKLVEGRLIIQGVSGAGKSWTLRRLLEQTASQIPQIVIDPEGEFKSLADELRYLHIAADQLDPNTLSILAVRLREQRASAVLDLSQLEREDQMTFFAAFAVSLVTVDKALWTPAIVAIDEAHIFAPYGAQIDISGGARKAAIGALVDIMSRGRKRGLAGILATQRLARLSKSAASEARNALIGLNTLDLDINRAAEHIGWTRRKASDRLPMLTPGDFVAVGSAFSQTPSIVRVGSVKSRHIGATPKIAAPPPADPDRLSTTIGLEALQEQSHQILDKTMGAGPRAVRAFIRDPAFSAAGAVYDALKKLSPDGATIANLAAHLERPRKSIEDALELLSRYRVIETVAKDGGTVARIDAEFARWRL